METAVFATVSSKCAILGQKKACKAANQSLLKTDMKTAVFNSAFKGAKEMKNLLNDPKFYFVVKHFERACAASRLHSSQAQRALANYGDHGSQISGCVRDHFPEAVKDQLRKLARMVTEASVSAMLARPDRVHRSTINQIGRLVATRDGSGFYGPQPYREGNSR